VQLLLLIVTIFDCGGDTVGGSWLWLEFESSCFCWNGTSKNV